MYTSRKTARYRHFRQGWEQGGGNVPLVLIQEKTGTLSSGAHPGSYNGQDAYNDMLVVDDGLERRKRTNESGEPIEEGGFSECDARSTDDFEGGGRWNIRSED